MQVGKTINFYRVRFTNFWESMDKYQNLLATLLFSLLITLGAKIRIYTPLSPVPFTLQTFFIMSASLYLRGKWSSMASLFYILLGIFGFPVFAGESAGITYLLGATGGYLIAFLIVPPLISHIFRRSGRTWRAGLLASLFGSLLILTIGSLYLGVYVGNMERGFLLGFVPFIGIEVAKALGATTSAKLLISRTLKT